MQNIFNTNIILFNLAFEKVRSLVITIFSLWVLVLNFFALAHCNEYLATKDFGRFSIISASLNKVPQCTHKCVLDSEREEIKVILATPGHLKELNRQNSLRSSWAVATRDTGNARTLLIQKAQVKGNYSDLSVTSFSRSSSYLTKSLRSIVLIV